MKSKAILVNNVFTKYEKKKRKIKLGRVLETYIQEDFITKNLKMEVARCTHDIK